MWLDGRSDPAARVRLAHRAVGSLGPGQRAAPHRVGDAPLLRRAVRSHGGRSDPDPGDFFFFDSEFPGLVPFSGI